MNNLHIVKWIRSLSLRVQLLAAICLVMLPLNGLLIYFSVVTVNNAEERLWATYINDTENFRKKLEDVSVRVEQEFDSFGTKYWNEMNIDVGLGMNSLSVIYMIDDLKAAWQKLDFMSGGFIKNNNENSVYITYDNSQIRYLAKEQLATSLASADLSGYCLKSGIFGADDGQYYVLWVRRVGDVDFGIFASVQNIIGELDEAHPDGEDFQVYITEMNGDVITGSGEYSGNINDCEKTWKIMTIESESMDYTICQITPRNILSGTLPLTVWGIVLLAVAALILIPVLWWLVRILVLKPLSRMNGAMREIENDHMDYRMHPELAESAELCYMEKSFNSMVQQIQDLRIEKYETEIEKLQIEAMNLKLSVNPHLLLNSLNMICSLAKIKDFDTIQQFGMHLASYFRYSLRNHERLVPLRDEMKFVKDYLDIQKIRYPGSFTSVYNIDEGLDSVCIPPLLIENFVENSIKYALKMGEVIEIIVIARKEEEQLVIAVIDSGNGMNKETLEKLRSGQVITDNIGSHIGIWNLRRRLAMFYGEDAVLNITSAPGEGTQIWVKIPMEKGENDESAHCR